MRVLGLHIYLDLLVRCLEKIKNILPNAGLIVIYHGKT